MKLAQCQKNLIHQKLVTLFLSFIVHDNKNDYYVNQCKSIQQKEEDNKNTHKWKMYPHNLSLVFNWTSAIENISDKKLVALSSSKFRARAETFNGVSITVSVHISIVNISNVWLIGICNQSEGRIGKLLSYFVRISLLHHQNLSLSINMNINLAMPIHTLLWFNRGG